MLAAGAVLVFLAGFAMPLADADLGMHLRIGEWIAQHGALPRIEPFAWTRRGAPFYAYSWLPEVAFFEILRVGGPWSLHALQGALVLTAALGAGCFARVVRTSPLATVLLVLLHVFTMLTLVSSLRPQMVLGTCVPLCWAATARLARDADRAARPAWWPFLALWGSAAIAANSHLLAPICVAPLAYVIPGRRVPLRTTLLAAGAVAIGLLSTPYALDWPAVLRLNFAPNALFRFPSPILEHEPGMVYVAHARNLTAVITVVLCALPWMLPHPVTRRSSVTLALAALWGVGLVAFGVAFRSLLPWWLVSLPLLTIALTRLPDLSHSMPARVIRAMPFAAVAAFGLEGARATASVRRYEGDTVRRALPDPWSFGAVALADTLERLAPRGDGRVLTTFDYGNALLWRLPRYSLSLDGRTIFPDSAAKMEGWVLAPESGDSIPTVLGSSDIAIVPVHHLVTRILRDAPGWQHIADAAPIVAGFAVDSATLWARDGWLARNGVVRPRTPRAATRAR